MRIDVHHHFFPAIMNKAEANKALGWRTPEEHLPWTPEVSLKAMDASFIDKAVLSFPAVPTFPLGTDPRKVARERNQMASEVRNKHPKRFGFFASLPLVDIEGSLLEITYALDVLKADGVALASCYGSGADAKYLGDECFDPIWAELDSRKTVVFLHGASVPSSTAYPHEYLGVPVCDTPNETFKAAAHLVVTGRKRKYCNVKIILAHLGGTTPFLAARVAILSRHMGCQLSPDEILEDFKTFYYETALSAHESTLKTMESFVTADRVLLGTDIPAVSADMAAWYTKNLEQHYADDKGNLDAVLFKNALRLMPNLELPIAG